MFNVDLFGLIPYLPYWCGATLGISFIGLASLLFIASYYSSLSIKQITKSMIRSHKNIVAKINQEPQLPPLSTHAILSKRASRRLRSILLISLNTFAIAFVLGYVVCAITAGSFQFWHVFEWFA